MSGRSRRHREKFRQPPRITRLVQVQNEYFTAGATFERIDGLWRVKECAPILHWMRKVPFDQIKVELLRRGCSWQWL